MKFIVPALVLIVVAARLRRHRRTTVRAPHAKSNRLSGDVALVMAREVRERFRGRVFKVTTLFVLLVVAAAIIIPVLRGGKTKVQTIGVVGASTSSLQATVRSSAATVGLTVRLVPESSVNAAKADLGAGRIYAAIVDTHAVLIESSLSPADVSSSAQFVRSLAENLGIAKAFQAANLSATQYETITHATALPIKSVEPGAGKSGRRSPTQATSVIGTILIFVMLSQYNTWILMGVMEEKSSRVIEVLLSAVRPIQLLTGKVLGIGIVALAQASLIVAFALALSKAVGSSLLHGSAPLVVASTLVWLVLGYSFYCWVYAAAGSMIERQDQVQSLVLPLSLPMIFGYIMALTGASSGSPSTLLKVLAFLPPTAPFTMPVLVGFGAVTWWAFLLSAAISVLCTIGIARLAATVYRRAILRTGSRVRLREVFN
ncbi:MAG: ABC transporter permease [Acidimicrobiales bacterium]